MKVRGREEGYRGLDSIETICKFTEGLIYHRVHYVGESRSSMYAVN